VGTQPPKLSNVAILAINFPIGSDSFAQFLPNSEIISVSTRL